jgi:predicted DCC family thiol-disulfide oxidoreductase YuxK
VSANGWTGGQYSVVRALLGTYLAAHFAMLVPYGAELFSNHGVLPDASASPLIGAFPNLLALHDEPWLVLAMLGAAALAGVLLAAGWRDRTAALAIAYVSACIYGRNPLISNPSLPYVGWMLIAHACLPPAPYGSWSARSRADARGTWTFPRSIHAAAWLAMAVGYSYSGLAKLASPSWLDGSALLRILENPLATPGWIRETLVDLPDPALIGLTFAVLALEVLFAPLALCRRARAWSWVAMAAMHLGLIAVIDFADLSLGMLALHAFTFDPAWVAPRGAGRPLRVYFDGGCGTCRRFVRFALAEAPEAAAFRFAPLSGETFRARVPPARRDGLPDSLVVEDGSGRLTVRGDAVLLVLERCGGLWRVLAAAARVVPAALRDGIYDVLARARRARLAPAAASCPVPSREALARFDP